MSSSTVKKLKSDAERQALLHTVKEAYMEIFPTPTIESKLDVLEPNSYVAVTCSPSKGVDVTLDMVGVVPGDCDLDGDADLDDYADLEACVSGPGGGIDPGCTCFDFDDNGDIDLVDLATFQALMFGS